MLLILSVVVGGRYYIIITPSRQFSATSRRSAIFALLHRELARKLLIKLVNLCIQLGITLLFFFNFGSGAGCVGGGSCTLAHSLLLFLHGQALLDSHGELGLFLCLDLLLAQLAILQLVMVMVVMMMVVLLCELQLRILNFQSNPASRIKEMMDERERGAPEYFLKCNLVFIG